MTRVLITYTVVADVDLEEFAADPENEVDPSEDGQDYVAGQYAAILASFFDNEHVNCKEMDGSSTHVLRAVEIVPDPQEA